MVRAFIAVDLAPDLKERLRSCQEVLRQGRARLTLVEPSIIHITIKFLGEIRDADIIPVSEALAGISLRPFDITLTGITGNNPGHPRVVWAKIEDGGACASLHARVEAVLAPLGFAPDDRPFRPHATIARVRSFDPSLVARIREIPPGPLGSCRVGGFALRKSTLTPKGPIYEDIRVVAW